MRSKLIFSLALVVLCLHIAGCGNNLPAAQTETFFPTKALLNISTQIPSSGGKKSTSVIEFELPTTQYSTVVSTPTEVGSVTPEATYTPDPLKSELLDFYGTNGNCKLPCWWGVIPEKTTEKELKALFVPYKDFVSYDEYDHILYYPALNNSVDYTISTLFFFENGIVTEIKLDGEDVGWI